MTIEFEEIATKHKIRDTVFDQASVLIADCQKLEVISGECILYTYAYLYLAFKMLSLAILWGAALGERKLREKDLIIPTCTGCCRVTQDLLWLLPYAGGSGVREV